MDISFNTILWAFTGGVLPALVWLWFWLKEDKRHPEPARLIMAAFVGGILVVPIALFLEKTIAVYLSGTAILFVGWATTEELLKFGAAYYVAFRKECIDRSRCLDETIDPLIYLITVALGFSALENTLFLIAPIEAGEQLLGFVTGNLRFVGATVLHIIASASIGVFMGLSFYKTPFVKNIYMLLGICTAILLHTLFNLSIIESNGSGLFLIFGVVWIGVIMLLALFEKIKKIKS